MKIQSETLDETLEKLRNIFISTTETSYLQCLDDPEILALIDPKLESSTKELLDNVRLFPSKIDLSQINFYHMYIIHFQLFRNDIVFLLCSNILIYSN